MEYSDHLIVLGLKVGATQQEIRAAYRTYTKAFHPDRFHGDVAMRRSAEEKMKEINAAFEHLQQNPQAQVTTPRPTRPTSRPTQAPRPAQPRPQNRPQPTRPRPAQTEAKILDKPLYDAIVIATNKTTRPGDFFRLVQEKAAQPIILRNLIRLLIGVYRPPTSAKDPKMVIRVRTRDAYTRLGYLRETAEAVHEAGRLGYSAR